MDQYPPKWMVNTLEAICPAHMRDEIEGDFFEYYAGMAKKSPSISSRMCAGQMASKVLTIHLGGY